MEFFDLHTSGSSSRPTITANQHTVIVALPTGLAESVGIAAGKAVKVQYGEDKTNNVKALRISPEEGGRWEVSGRKQVMHVHVREIMPAAPVAKTPVEFTTDDRSITLTLPDGWALAAEHLVNRTAKPAARAARR